MSYTRHYDGWIRSGYTKRAELVISSKIRSLRAQGGFFNVLLKFFNFINLFILRFFYETNYLIHVFNAECRL